MQWLLVWRDDDILRKLKWDIFSEKWVNSEVAAKHSVAWQLNGATISRSQVTTNSSRLLQPEKQLQFASICQNLRHVDTLFILTKAWRLDCLSWIQYESCSWLKIDLPEVHAAAGQKYSSSETQALSHPTTALSNSLTKQKIQSPVIQSSSGTCAP